MDQPSHSGGSLQRGATIGPYTVREAIGAGGMGEVYRAYDTKLERDVAIKVVTALEADDGSRLRLLEREARVLASLNHPGIASIYGLEESEGAPALVLELVVGPTLADAIAGGPLPVDESLATALRLADALEYAHERGIVHRDLKPGNIKIMDSGAVKILDFGLAKALRDAPGGEGSSARASTLGATQAGMILGTPDYMAPEQAEGRSTDRRSDVWAFGCVLFEMLTGRPPFQARTVPATLAAVLGTEPAWERLPAATPESVRSLLVRCLTKDPRRRLQAIGDARIVLEDASDDSVPAPAPGLSGPPRARRLGPIAAALLLVAAAAWATGRHFRTATGMANPVVRFTIDLPDGQALTGNNGSMLALSRDGTKLAYVATSADAPRGRIYVLALDQSEPKALAGTDGAASPFFSPDGDWVGYFAEGKLRKVAATGGEARTLADDLLPWGGTWTDDHSIVFASFGQPLQEVSDTGGAVRVISTLDKGEESHQWPSILPGSDELMFMSQSDAPVLGLRKLGADGRRNIMRLPSGAIPTFDGSTRVVVQQSGGLMAVPFDAGRPGLVTGTPVPVLDGVAGYALSGTGTLAYVTGAEDESLSVLVWVRRDGHEEPVGAPPRPYNQPRAQPHGRRIAVDITAPAQLWSFDPVQDRFDAVTFGGTNRHSAWSPDGRRMAFMSDRDGAAEVYILSADGSGTVERVMANPDKFGTGILDLPYSWSPDGRLLAIAHITPKAGSDVMAVHIDDVPRQVDTIMHVSSVDGGPTFSPDGRWLAYAADDPGGHRQIFVQAFPGPGGKHQITTDGGNEPMWGHDPRKLELFYRDGPRMMAVNLQTRPIFSASRPHMLFQGPYRTTMGGYVRPDYDVSSDDQRFLMLKPVSGLTGQVNRIHVVLNWSTEVSRLVSAGR